MPTYTFENTETGEVYDATMSMAEYDEYIKQPNIKRVYSKAPALGDPMRMGITKPPEAFRDILRKMKKKHAHNTINII